MIPFRNRKSCGNLAVDDDDLVKHEGKLARPRNMHMEERNKISELKKTHIFKLLVIFPRAKKCLNIFFPSFFKNYHHYANLCWRQTFIKKKRKKEKRALLCILQGKEANEG